MVTYLGPIIVERSFTLAQYPNLTFGLFFKNSSFLPDIFVFFFVFIFATVSNFYFISFPFMLYKRQPVN